MKKKDFLNNLRYRIRELEKNEIKDVLNYYSELIDDRLENGEKEEDIISSLGSMDIIVENIMEGRKCSASSLDSDQKKHEKKREGNMSVVKLILLILLFPLWISLAAILFGLLIGFFGIMIGVAAATFAISLSGIYYFIGSFVHMGINLYAGIVQCGISLLCIVLGLILGRYVLRFCVVLCRKFMDGIKRIFKGRSLIYE